MSNNDGADFARTMAMGEEIARLMVEVEALRKENAWLKHMMKADERHGLALLRENLRLRDVLREIAEKLTPEKYEYENCLETNCGELARAALGEGKE